MLILVAGIELTAVNSDTPTAFDTGGPPAPGDHPQRRELRVEADSFHSGRDRLRAMVPDGYKIVWIRTGD